MKLAARPPRPQYTAEEIHAKANNLPGFETPGSMYDIFEGPDSGTTLWQAVLSTTVVTKLDGEIHVLTGTRTGEGNTTHVNVASTPTMRTSTQEAGLLLSDDATFCLEGEIDPLHPFASDSLTPSVVSLPDSTDVIGSKVGGLLAQKLQLAAALETQQEPIGQASIARYVAGFSHLDFNREGQPLFEPLIMFGAIVGLRPDVAKMAPETTSSYANLGWVPIEQYVHGVAAKEVIEVIPAANPADELEVCVKGLCNATSSRILSGREEIDYQLTEGGILSEWG